MKDYSRCPPYEIDNHSTISIENGKSPSSPISRSQSISSKTPITTAESKRAPLHEEIELGSDDAPNTLPSPTSDPEVQQKKSVWRNGWRTPAAFLGFYLLALLCAISHLCFFLYLDRRVILYDTKPTPKWFRRTRLNQGIVTTMSLFLVTSFRAALGAAVGICYTQYLWTVLRSRAMEVELIEDLFQIQRNAFDLLNYKTVIYTPVLAGIALFGWLIPIGMIYPPGALIVRPDNVTFPASFNVSVLWDEGYKFPGWNASVPEFDTSNRTVRFFINSNERVADLTANRNLQDLVANTLINGEIQNLHGSTAENSTYTMEFWGPTLECEETMITIPFNFSLAQMNNDKNLLIPWGYNEPIGTFGVPSFVPAPETEVRYRGWSMDQLRAMTSPDAFFEADDQADEVTATLDYQSLYFRISANIGVTNITWPFYPCPSNLDVMKNAQYTLQEAPQMPRLVVLAPTREVICKPKLSKYHLNIEYVKGIQTVTYFTTNESLAHDWTPVSKNYTGSMAEWVQISDVWTIYNTFATILQHQTLFWSDKPTAVAPANKTETLPDGTSVSTCQFQAKSFGENAQVYSKYGADWVWRHFVFATRQPDSNPVVNMMSDNRRMIHDALANVTISAMSITGRYEVINGTESQTLNRYRFEYRLAFYLPYGLCILVSAPMMILGLLALQWNGATAISGGFLQIIMATAGDSSMRAVAAQGGMGGRENVPLELLKMKVRFGQLAADEEALRVDTIGKVYGNSVGFGSSEEIRPLQRGSTLGTRKNSPLK